MLERTDVITNEVLEPITFVLACPTVIVVFYWIYCDLYYLERKRWVVLKHKLHCPAFWWRNMHHILHWVSPKVTFRCKICERHSIWFHTLATCPRLSVIFVAYDSSKLTFFCSLETKFKPTWGFSLLTF